MEMYYGLGCTWLGVALLATGYFVGKVFDNAASDRDKYAAAMLCLVCGATWPILLPLYVALIPIALIVIAIERIQKKGRKA
jgi:membrane protein DedA with SNARE-associated domain